MLDFLKRIEIEPKPLTKKTRPKGRGPGFIEFEDRRHYPPMDPELLKPRQIIPKYDMPTGLELAMMLCRVGRPKKGELKNAPH